MVVLHALPHSSGHSISTAGKAHSNDSLLLHSGASWPSTHPSLVGRGVGALEGDSDGAADALTEGLVDGAGDG